MGSQANPGVRAPPGPPTHITHPAIQAAHPLSLYDTKGIALAVGFTAHGVGLNYFDPRRVTFVFLNT